MIRGTVYAKAAQSRAVTGTAHVLVSVASTLDATRRVTVEAVVDTGFDGFLTLPPAMIRRLGLPRIGGPLQGRLANDETHEFYVHVGMVTINGQTRGLPVYAIRGPILIGMALMWGSRLTIDLQEGGDVTIEELDTADGRD